MGKKDERIAELESELERAKRWVDFWHDTHARMNLRANSLESEKANIADYADMLAEQLSFVQKDLEDEKLRADAYMIAFEELEAKLARIVEEL